ncbi:nuclear transcription factor Y subunit C-2-like [Impatiens glandulifera]|uniref:nuclear transcription factor Y subunit C-2-like n=1 Tax=Impatiens glandulifera TaxID=253017 RepID=UPI001FB188E8|nr:nuclear transcription factor Y subunit C-2-like [Impatiens glandulifera]XP_047336767.1 nuclear transcription factor Y subunit C-2-like [Impatiens glandulifera]XP_047336770.1 nuclear transcription factor Y subunit C-2-like [Impatiens glandulifera]
MDQSDPSQQQHAGAAGNQMGAYGSSSQPYPSGPVQPQAGFANPQHQLAYQQAQQFHHQHQQQHQQQQLQSFWENQMQEIEETVDFKNHSLPLARIKKIMKADKDVRMISAEAPVLFAKACEMFIQELTLQSWQHTEEHKRRTLQKSDISAALSRNDVFDFLVDVIPRDEPKEEGLGVTKTTIPTVVDPTAADSMPYYYVPSQQQPVCPPGVIVGKPVDQGPVVYGGQPVAFMPWNPSHQHQHQADKQ